MIGIVIAKLLTDSTALAALVGTKIFPYMIDEKSTLPAVFYDVNSITPEYDKDGWNGDLIQADITSVSFTYINCLTISSEVRKAVELKKGIIESQNISSIRISNISEGLDIDNGIYFSKITIIIKKQ